MAAPLGVTVLRFTPTRVVGIFPNEAACLRLVSAIAMEISDDWLAGKAYLTLTPD